MNDSGGSCNRANRNAVGGAGRLPNSCQRQRECSEKALHRKTRASGDPSVGPSEEVERLKKSDREEIRGIISRSSSNSL